MYSEVDRKELAREISSLCESVSDKRNTMHGNVQFYFTSYNVCVVGVEILLCLEVFTVASSGLEIRKRRLSNT